VLLWRPASDIWSAIPRAQLVVLDATVRRLQILSQRNEERSAVPVELEPLRIM
jgi:hypothetical protein